MKHLVVRCRGIKMETIFFRCEYLNFMNKPDFTFLQPFYLFLYKKHAFQE